MKNRIYAIFCIFLLVVTLDACAQSGLYKKITSVYDYEYQKNTYFFISNHYRNHFEEGLTRDLLSFHLDDFTQIELLQVWISTTSSDPKAISTIAVLDPEEYDPENENSLCYKGYFKPLPSTEYGFDGNRGYFWLSKPADDDTVIAVSYLLIDEIELDLMGNHLKKPGSDVLRLIKPKNQTPSEAFKDTWPLMMKNVYDLRHKNLDNIKYLNLEISKTDTVVSETNESEKETLHAFGLDMIDEWRYYKRKGDGVVDINSFNLKLKDGILIFPGLHPFNPDFESRFQIKDEDKADIYNSDSMETLQKNSRFKITLIDMLKPKAKTALNTDKPAMDDDRI